jgi:O-methyltransferase involved in polyketide biosynthesis
MNNVNKTLYIPLYGKAYVSRRSLFLRDVKAEEIWEAEKFQLKGKSKSKYLAFYMGIRAAVFDEWVKEQTELCADTVVIHIGCGMDSRAERTAANCSTWYDVDFPEVIEERKRYYSESGNYKMIACDARDTAWLADIPKNKKAIVVMEGVSMYLEPSELRSVLEAVCGHFEGASVLMDCYSVFAAKMSKYKNPVNDVGVTSVYGIDDPRVLESDSVAYVKEHGMTPENYIDELTGAEKLIFRKLYAGGFAKRLYRLYEYGKKL